MFARFASTPKKAPPATQEVVKSNAGPGQPLELVQYDTNTGKFSVGQQALKVLRSIKGPVGVVSVCGRARQGKSYILNQLLGQSSGFVVAPTHRPCTKGLWMWSAPVLRQSPDGSTYHLVRDVRFVLLAVGFEMIPFHSAERTEIVILVGMHSLHN